MKQWIFCTLIAAASLQAAPTTVLNESGLDNLVKQGTVVIDFSTEDCVPCRRFKPIFSQVADELSGDYKFAQIDIIDPSNIWEKYNIQSVPTVILFKDGKEVRRHGSFASKDGLKKFIAGSEAPHHAGVKSLTGSDFDQTIASGDTIVEFYVEWCGACKRFAPIYEEVAGTMSRVGQFAKLSIPDGRQIADRYHVKRTPTLIVFRDGSEIGRQEGALSPDALKNFITNTLN